MKRITLLMAILLAMMTVHAQIPNYYQPSVVTEPYQQLTNGTKLTEVPGNSLYILSPGGPWTFFGEKTDNDTLVIGMGGFIVTTGTSYSMAFDPFLSSLSEKPGGTSGVYYEIDSSSNPVRMSIEWRDMALNGHAASDAANFRINFYSNEVVEFHYGSSVVTGTAAFNGNAGPQVVNALLTRDFTGAWEIRFAVGNPANPTFTSQPAGATYLNGAPANGTMYRFEPYNLSMDEKAQLVGLKMYPVPATDRLIVEGSTGSEVRVIQLDGKVVLEPEVFDDSIDISGLTPGVYFLQVTDSGHISTTRFIKE